MWREVSGITTELKYGKSVQRGRRHVRWAFGLRGDADVTPAGSFKGRRDDLAFTERCCSPSGALPKQPTALWVLGTLDPMRPICDFFQWLYRSIRIVYRWRRSQSGRFADDAPSGYFSDGLDGGIFSMARSDSLLGFTEVDVVARLENS